MRESLSLYREWPGEPGWTAAVGEVRPARSHELPPGYRHGLRYAVPLAEMPRYLPWLEARVRTLGGQVTRRQLRSLDEVGDGTDVVINCAGLGAGELVDDPSVYPVRGQVVRVGNPGLTMSVRDEDHPGGRAYVHPRTEDCIVGGTLDEGNGTPGPTRPSVQRSWRGVSIWCPRYAMPECSTRWWDCGPAARPSGLRRASGCDPGPECCTTMGTAVPASPCAGVAPARSPRSSADRPAAKPAQRKYCSPPDG